MGLLDGKVAFITGGARGQGRAHAVLSAREGADVILVDTFRQVATAPYTTAREEDMKETVRQIETLGGSMIAVEADVRSQEALDQAVAAGLAKFGQIDILIANAGIWGLGPFWELPEDTWNEMIDINLTGVWKTAKAVAPHMMERQTGSIVITSSVNGLEPGANYAHYVASKHGVVGLMTNIALELAAHGIRCNSVHPGAIKTPMTNNQGSWDMFAGHEGGTEEEMIEGGYHFHALRSTTFMPPEVIANTALYLNSELAAHVTGATIPVDAGHMLLTGVNQNPVR